MTASAAAVSVVAEDARQRSADRWLLRAAGVFAVAVVLHNGDHLRRGSDAVSSDVFWVGNLAIALEVLVVVLIYQRHRLAALAAVAAGSGLAAGYVVVHFLPGRGWLSDSFTTGVDVSLLSWIAASVELLAAGALAVAGWLVISRRGGLAAALPPNRATATSGRAGLHPVALAFAVSQVATVAIAFGQR